MVFHPHYSIKLHCLRELIPDPLHWPNVVYATRLQSHVICDVIYSFDFGQKRRLGIYAKLLQFLGIEPSSTTWQWCDACHSTTITTYIRFVTYTWLTCQFTLKILDILAENYACMKMLGAKSYGRGRAAEVFCMVSWRYTRARSLSIFVLS